MISTAFLLDRLEKGGSCMNKFEGVANVIIS